MRPVVAHVRFAPESRHAAGHMGCSLNTKSGDDEFGVALSHWTYRQPRYLNAPTQTRSQSYVGQSVGMIEPKKDAGQHRPESFFVYFARGDRACPGEGHSARDGGE